MFNTARLAFAIATFSILTFPALAQKAAPAPKPIDNRDQRMKVDDTDPMQWVATPIGGSDTIDIIPCHKDYVLFNAIRENEGLPAELTPDSSRSLGLGWGGIGGVWRFMQRHTSSEGGCYTPTRFDPAVPMSLYHITRKRYLSRDDDWVTHHDNFLRVTEGRPAVRNGKRVRLFAIRNTLTNQHLMLCRSQTPVPNLAGRLCWYDAPNLK